MRIEAVWRRGREGEGRGGEGTDQHTGEHTPSTATAKKKKTRGMLTKANR